MCCFIFRHSSRATGREGRGKTVPLPEFSIFLIFPQQNLLLWAQQLPFVRAEGKKQKMANQMWPQIQGRVHSFPLQRGQIPVPTYLHIYPPLNTGPLCLQLWETPQALQVPHDVAKIAPVLSSRSQKSSISISQSIHLHTQLPSTWNIKI